MCNNNNRYTGRPTTILQVRARKHAVRERGCGRAFALVHRPTSRSGPRRPCDITATWASRRRRSSPRAASSSAAVHGDVPRPGPDPEASWSCYGVIAPRSGCSTRGRSDDDYPDHVHGLPVHTDLILRASRLRVHAACAQLPDPAPRCAIVSAAPCDARPAAQLAPPHRSCSISFATRPPLPCTREMLRCSMLAVHSCHPVTE